MGKDVKWALDIAVTTLALAAFLPLVSVVLVLRPLKTSGASETEVTAGGAVRLLSGRAEMLLSR